MTDLTVIRLSLVLIFIFMFSVQIVILLAIRNAVVCSKVKAPFFWLFVSFTGLSLSLVSIVYLLSVG